MRRYLYVIVTGIVFLTLSSMVQNEEKFYYAFGAKTALNQKDNVLFVKFNDSINKIIKEKYLKDVQPDVKIKWHTSQIAEIATNSKFSFEELSAKLKLKEDVVSCLPFYTLDDGLAMGVTNEILIRFLPDITEKQKIELHKKFNTKVIKTTKIYQKLIISNGYNALEVANRYFETGLVEFATPDFVSYGEYSQIIPNDSYFNNQITLHNTGQIFNDGHKGNVDADIDAPEAWVLTRGCNNIVIAVLDQGVTPNHPDLPNERQVRLNGSNFGGGNVNDPSPTVNNNHGNSCAGVIAATMNNNEGIAGVAPNCRIMPIRMPDNFDPEIVADAIEFAVDNGARILSNSWGYGTTNQNAHPVIVAAINHAINNNCVVVFASGNNANHTSNSNGYVTFPANVNIPGVITVGASDRYDKEANYSPKSSLIDVVAPSHRAYPDQISGETGEMWSIDIPGNTGYNPYPNDPFMPHPPASGEILPNTGTNNLAYTGRFGGTSHACPVVAGVAALLLSVNQNLSNLEVFNILTGTTDKVGGYVYSNNRCNEMGFGRINAYASVQRAAGGPITGASIVCSNGTSFLLPYAIGLTVFWTHSSNLTLVSGQGTNQLVVKAVSGGDPLPTAIMNYENYGGTGWVRATMAGTCDNVVLQKDIWVGLPAYTPIVTGSSTMYCSQSLYVEKYNRNATWSVYGPLQVVGPNYGHKCTVKGTESGAGWVYATNSNVCGSFRGELLVQVSCSSYSVFPNPTNSEVTIALLPDNSIDKSFQKDKSIKSIRVVDKSGITLYTQKYGSDTFETKIDLSGFTTGVYIIKINEENEEESYTVIKQ